MGCGMSRGAAVSTLLSRSSMELPDSRSLGVQSNQEYQCGEPSESASGGVKPTPSFYKRSAAWTALLRISSHELVVCRHDAPESPRPIRNHQHGSDNPEPLSCLPPSYQPSRHPMIASGACIASPFLYEGFHSVSSERSSSCKRAGCSAQLM